MTLALTGLRSSEVRWLKWQHIDDGIATIVSPKGGPDRSFQTPLPSRVIETLGETEFEHSSPFCFPSLGPLNDCRGMPMLLRKTDEVPYRPHQLRHTFRTTALEAGVDFQSVQLLMNHKLPGVSGNYVSRDRLMEHLRGQIELVANLLVGTG